jgi:hypothetical protein
MFLFLAIKWDGLVKSFYYIIQSWMGKATTCRSRKQRTILNQPTPYELIPRIVRHRLAENQAQAEARKNCLKEN